jgi:type IV pilus assembly protein PilY1
MKKIHPAWLNKALQALAITALAGINLSVQAVVWPDVPAGASTTAVPMTMLVASKDHKLFYEAYNDASDINGDGELDIRFKPNILYYGLFDPKVCYTHNDKNDKDGLFTPSALSTDTVTYKCPGKWSGNWLNYVTTSRIDALRKVLYGGHREVDTSSETILRRAYIPQDTHSWAKEYTSETVDGYKISDYTPLAQPSGSGTRRHFFGNLTASAGTNCATPDDCSNKLHPWLSVVTNSTKRVWEWASKERPVLDGSHGGTRTDRTVRVKVCTGSFLTDCKKYGSSSYKPVGLLHDYGESNAMLFGLLTGSYNKNMSGGVLRQVITSFSKEVSSTTGVFTANATIVKNFNALRIRDYNNGRSDGFYRNGSFRTGTMAEGAYVDWGNPVGEMMYESLRYLAGKKGPTSAFNTSGSHDGAIGLSVATWDDPYESGSAASAYWCARPNMLVMSDSYPSYDADQIPGSPYAASMSTDLTGFSASTLLGSITYYEPNVKGLKFAGQTTASNNDYAPSAKTVDDLSYVRGLAPEEPAKLGSYSAAAVAYYAKTKGFSLPDSKSQTVDSFFVTFASPAPSIAFTVGGRTVTVVPFAKTVDGASTNRSKGYYQPTDPIVDVYVRTVANTSSANTDASINGGRPYMQYNIIYEADEQGNDFDMDVNSLYTLSIDSTGKLVVEVQVIYESTGSNQNIGYVISGTNRDGIYMVATDKNESLPYFLNTPPARGPGYCDPEPGSTDARYNECRQLPYLGGGTGFDRSIETFTASTATGATFLKDPLWYAAKWGGFKDLDGNARPNNNLEWDENGDKVPDSYFFVQNPLKLKEALTKAFDTIIKNSGSGGNVIANSTSVTDETRVYQATFDSNNWSGDLEAYPVDSTTGVGTVTAWKASQQMPAPDSRRIVYRADDGTGKTFEWSNLSTSEKGKLGSSDVLDYIRGVRTKEVQNGGTLRNRPIPPFNNVLGDITHSSPFYVKDTDTVYIGANDGMLHAFDASTGVEQFAFIPSSSVSRLVSLTNLSYNSNHKYFVDGDMAVSSLAQTGTVNYLVSTLGRGGKGLFGLNVSNPSGFSGSDVLWEYMSASDTNLGYMLGRPKIAQMKTGQWAVIVGNGYNSSDGTAVLYVFDLATGAVIRKIDTGIGGDNGLATPGVRLDTDGRAMTVYAGDLKGNVWEFDVSSTTASTWAVANSGSPFFTATDSAGNAQPITAPVTMALNTVSGDPHYNKLFVYVGTGSNFQVTDTTSTQTQTWYGLIDEGAVISSRGDLKTRTVTITSELNGTPVRVFESATDGDMIGMKGFKMDLPESGERIVTASNYYYLAEPVLLASSVIPMVDTCAPGGRGYVNAISAFTGAALTKPFFDVDGDGSFSDDTLSGGYVGSVDLGVGMPGEAIITGNLLVVGGSKGIIESIRINTGSVPLTGRLSWREIVRD